MAETCRCRVLRCVLGAVLLAVGVTPATRAAIKVGSVTKTSPYTCTKANETITVSGAESGQIIANADCTIILNGVTWTAGTAGANLIDVGNGKKVLLKLSGENTLSSAKESVTAICVCQGSQLDITNLTDTAALTITMSSKYCSAIGSAKSSNKSPAGTINIWGGTVNAQSKGKGAGIGGYESDGGMVNIYGGTVVAEGGQNGAAGIGGGYGGAGGTVNIYGGSVTATGGCDGTEYDGGAGIGGGRGGAGGTVNIYGGTVVAKAKGHKSAYGGAGIGGGYKGQGGAVTVWGGDVTATSEGEGAGIGGGDGAGNGGVVKVYGGIVRATGGSNGDANAAGIGGGSGGDSGEFYNYGGTVFATAGGKKTGSDEAGDIGKGHTHDAGASKARRPFIIKGGSTRLAYGKYSGVYGMGVASNGTVAVSLVTVSGLAANAKCEFTGLPDYGQADLFADDNGAVYLWLPDGTYAFTDAAYLYTVTVAGADATAVRTAKPAPSGASAVKNTVRVETDDGRVLLTETDGDCRCTTFALDPSAPQTPVLRFHADVADGVDFAAWVAATASAGKFRLLKAYDLKDLDDPDARLELTVSAAVYDAAAGIFAITGDFIDDLAVRKQAFFRLLIDD